MVSICIATYNGEKYIQQQLDSILPFLTEIDEILISDDNSNDNTINLINQYKDNRIKIFYNNFRNSTLNFEFLLNKTNGDIIFLCDQDDIWLPNKIPLFKKLLISQYDLVLSDCSIVDNNLNVLTKSFFKWNNSQQGFYNNILRNSYMGCCIAFNKKVLKNILPFPTKISKFSVVHDYWIGMIAEKYYKIYYLESITLLHRKHDNNASNTALGTSSLTFYKKIKLRFTILFYLLRK